MELVGAHKEALSALDSIDGGKASAITSTSQEDVISFVVSHGIEEKEVRKNEKNGGKDNKCDPKGQLIHEEEREKGKVGFEVYWKYVTTTYGGALVPLILIAEIMFQLLQIGSNYWMAWATPISSDAEPPVGGSALIFVYVALAIGSSICVLARATLVATTGYKTATSLFNNMHLCIFRAPMSFFDATPSGRILNRVCGTMMSHYAFHLLWF